jgi:hypothetical protein
LNPGSAMDEIVSKPKAKPAAKKEESASTDFDFDTPAPKAAAKVEETATTVDNSDDLDSFLNDLDL